MNELIRVPEIMTQGNSIIKRINYALEKMDLKKANSLLQELKIMRNANN